MGLKLISEFGMVLQLAVAWRALINCCCALNVPVDVEMKASYNLLI